MKVIKRDDSIVEFDRAKIVAAIQKANQAVDEPYRLDEGSIDVIADAVAATKGRKRLLVEDIQDMVETKLMAAGKYELAKTYIIYRYTRALVRKANTTDESILSLIRNDNTTTRQRNRLLPRPSRPGPQAASSPNCPPRRRTSWSWAWTSAAPTSSWWHRSAGN